MNAVGDQLVCKKYDNDTDIRWCHLDQGSVIEHKWETLKGVGFGGYPYTLEDEGGYFDFTTDSISTLLRVDLRESSGVIACEEEFDGHLDCSILAAEY